MFTSSLLVPLKPGEETSEETATAANDDDDSTRTASCFDTPFWTEYGGAIAYILSMVLAFFVGHLVLVFARATGVTASAVEATLFALLFVFPAAAAMYVTGSRERERLSGAGNIFIRWFGPRRPASSQLIKAQALIFLGLSFGWNGQQVADEGLSELTMMIYDYYETNWPLYVITALELLACYFWYVVMVRVL